MDKYDVKFKKKFGQNFLKNNNIVRRIVDVSGVDDSSLVIEVGPGGGILTKELSKVAKNVLAYEIDQDLNDELFKRIGDCDNVVVLYQDFLLSNLSEDISQFHYEKLFFVSNVPYYITTPIITKLIDSGLIFDNIVMMVQREVGDRFSTKPGSRDYGSITVLLNYYFDIKKEFFVSRKEFVPEPNVDSVIISFKENKNKLYVKDIKFFERFIHDCFQFKRKTIKNNLKNYDLTIVSNVLSKHGYDLNVRAEMLDLDIFVELSNLLVK